jgi:aminoglycoside phosphotransferase (APT) family kinase protein
MTSGVVPGLDVEAVEAWMHGLELGAEPPLRLVRIGDGKSNLTYVASDAGGRRWILRRPPLGEHLDSAHDVAREFGILRGLSRTQVPAPRVYALCTDADICDEPLVLMEYVDGVVIDSDAAAQAMPESRRATSSLSLARTLATVHGVDLDATGLIGLASHAPYAARQLKRWRRQWEQSRMRDLPLADSLHERLSHSAPEQHEVTLVHGDYHLLNVIIDNANGTVRSVLDWELSTLGDPLADLGGLLAYWCDDDDPIAIGPFAFSRLPGFASRAQLSAAYADASGRDLSALPYWEALASWKIAIILEGVRRREVGDPRLGEPLDQAIVDGLFNRSKAIADAVGL